MVPRFSTPLSEMPEQEFSKTNTEPFGNVNSETFKVEIDEENPAHVGVLNAWADAILHGGKLVADGCEGINGLSLSNAMHLSSFLDKEIILPLDDELYYDEFKKRIATSKKKETISGEFADASAVMGSTKS